MTRNGFSEAHARPQLPEHALQAFEHQVSVQARVTLGPEQVTTVRLERRGAGEKHGKIRVRQLGAVKAAACALDVIFGELGADTAASRVKHEPHIAQGIEAELDEVVAAAERPDLVRGAPGQVLNRCRQPGEASEQRLHP
jgi:hypothetical protein